VRRALAGLFLLLAGSGDGLAGELRGQVETLAAGYPSLDRVEGRLRILLRYQSRLGERWFVLASAYADGVVGSGERENAAIVRPHETYLERRGPLMELRIGYSNVVWGVLDEIQPTDVVNPIDVSRFVLEGRSEARLPVPLARLRFFLPRDVSLEAVVAPLPRQGTFDQVHPASSPFAPAGWGSLPRSETPVTGGNVEGGVRLRGSNAGVDWGASFYRDVVDFDRYTISAGRLAAIRPHRWMAGGDLETARGEWVLRAEGAFYLHDPLQVETAPVILRRWSFQGGFGADRAVGENRLFLNALYRHVPQEPLLGERNDLSLVFGLSRDFGRSTKSFKLFGLWNARAGSGFVRASLSLELVENLRLELAGGAFLGEGGEILGSFADSDFALVRLRFYF
jgi:hypothetical protein